jgi:DNA-binding FrmR family transcriptional regulator
MSHTVKEKHNLLLRAKRIQGQVEALVRTLDEERDCSEVLQVMSAARGAMNSLMAELLEGHIRSHVLGGKRKPTSQQVVAADEVIDMVKSYLK